MPETTYWLRQHAVELHNLGILDLAEPKAYPIWLAADLIDQLEARLAEYISGTLIVEPKSAEHAQAMIDEAVAFINSEKKCFELPETTS